MKKIILGILCTLFLLVVPSHFSNTSEITSTMTKEEKIEFRLRIKESIINNKVEKEYELFFNNLDEIGTPCFVQDFFNKLIYEAVDSKSLPSILIAQAAVETGYGKHNKLKNNIFGIKGRGIRTQTKEFYKGRFITIRANFQYFPTLKDAFNRHYQILNRYGVYGYNYNIWIERIVAGGYATDPNYDKKLKYVIEKYELHRLDEIQKLKSVKVCNLNEIYSYINL